MDDGKKPNIGDPSTILNPFFNRKSSKSAWASLMFSKFASGSFEGGWNDLSELSAMEATEYILLNSDDWLKTVCQHDGVRAEIEKAMWKSQKSLYMVTGYRTLLNSSRRRTQDSGVKGEVTARIPVSESQGDASGALDSGDSLGGSHESSTDVGMQAPGEKIYEIQYRKVRLGYFSSQKKGDAYLEHGNRWIKVFTFRDGSGSEDEDDAVEAAMDDVMGVPPGHHLVEEDGERSYIPIVEA